MLHCRTCGQCHLIDPEQESGKFYSYQATSGWQRIAFDPFTGDISDWGGIDHIEATGSDPDGIICPYCNENNVDTEWNGLEEASRIRDNYIFVHEQQNREWKEIKIRTELKNTGIMESEWDEEQNNK